VGYRAPGTSADYGGLRVEDPFASPG
jgi:hypothetical protein